VPSSRWSRMRTRTRWSWPLLTTPSCSTWVGTAGNEGAHRAEEPRLAEVGGSHRGVHPGRVRTPLPRRRPPHGALLRPLSQPGPRRVRVPSEGGQTPSEGGQTSSGGRLPGIADEPRNAWVCCACAGRWHLGGGARRAVSPGLGATPTWSATALNSAGRFKRSGYSTRLANRYSGSTQKLVLVIDLGAPVAEDEFRRPGLRVVDSSDRSVVIAFADDPQLVGLLERLDACAAGVRPGQSSEPGAFYANLGHGTEAPKGPCSPRVRS
jgi:hypothetical protein